MMMGWNKNGPDKFDIVISNQLELLKHRLAECNEMNNGQRFLEAQRARNVCKRPWKSQARRDDLWKQSVKA